MADDTPKKGDAAPLEGVLGPEIMMVLGCAFASMSLNMCRGLTLAAGQALEAPLLKADLETIAPQVSMAAANSLQGTAPAIANPMMSGPKMSTPFGV